MKSAIKGNYGVVFGTYEIKPMTKSNFNKLISLLKSGTGIFWETRRIQFKRLLNGSLPDKFKKRHYVNAVQTLVNNSKANDWIMKGSLNHWSDEQINLLDELIKL